MGTMYATVGDSGRSNIATVWRLERSDDLFCVARSSLVYLLTVLSMSHHGK